MKNQQESIVEVLEAISVDYMMYSQNGKTYEHNFQRKIGGFLSLSKYGTLTLIIDGTQFRGDWDLGTFHTESFQKETMRSS